MSDSYKPDIVFSGGTMYTAGQGAMYYYYRKGSSHQVDRTTGKNVTTTQWLLVSTSPRVPEPSVFYLNKEELERSLTSHALSGDRCIKGQEYIKLVLEVEK